MSRSEPGARRGSTFSDLQYKTAGGAVRAQFETDGTPLSLEGKAVDLEPPPAVHWEVYEVTVDVSATPRNNVDDESSTYNSIHAAVTFADEPWDGYQRTEAYRFGDQPDVGSVVETEFYEDDRHLMATHGMATYGVDNGADGISNPTIFRWQDSVIFDDPIEISDLQSLSVYIVMDHEDDENVIQAQESFGVATLTVGYVPISQR